MNSEFVMYLLEKVGTHVDNITSLLHFPEESEQVIYHLDEIKDVAKLVIEKIGGGGV